RRAIHRCGRFGHHAHLSHSIPYVNPQRQFCNKAVQNWIVALATQKIASEAAHMREVVIHAKSGAAAAYHAMVGIPIVGPILAPVAAATAFAGIMAFSAEGGMDRVPYDGAHLIAHKDEMVLSAQFANPLRDMLSGGSWRLPASVSTPFASMPTASAANSNAPAAANDGGGHTYNVEYHDHTGTATPDKIFANRGALAKAVIMAHREGRFDKTKFGRD
ncbi:hypothetical protein, partial [Sphingomonas psychrolutea]|uniref:hypothetical protein n=1 Tax=Sphingomonas psychrolutea TaxID=1259676 RepID=UPI001E53087D